MTRPMVSVRHPETHKRIIREMNDEEFEQWEIDQAQAIINEEEQETKKQAKKVKANKLVKELAKLNNVDLTKDEIAELLGLTI